jgi:glycosyltransferase involved in cell wall biosynthesis
MKIYYSHDIFTEQEYGGVSRYFTEIIKRISKIDPEVYVLSGIYFNKYLSGIRGECNINGSNIRNTFWVNKYVLRCINEAYQSFSLYGKNKIIFHQTYYSPFSISSKLRVVITVHDMVHELFPEMFHSMNPTSYAKKKSCDRADKIIVVSESTKKNLIDLFDINPNKIEVVYHGTTFFECFKNIKPYKHECPYLLFVGARQGCKNFDKILKIFSQSSKIFQNFNLICFGGGKFTKEELQKIFNYKLSNVVYHRTGQDSVLAQYYAGARALIYPSRYEGFGIPLLEAMSMKCPVICSNESSLPEVALDAAIYFNPNDIEDIKDTLEKVLFDDNTLSQISIKGFERQKFFTWEKTAQKTLEVYKSIY